MKTLSREARIKAPATNPVIKGYITIRIPHCRSISLGKIYDFKACYSDYVELRAEGREQQLATFNNQQKQIQDIEKFISRFRAQATKAKQEKK